MKSATIPFMGECVVRSSLNLCFSPEIFICAAATTKQYMVTESQLPDYEALAKKLDTERKQNWVGVGISFVLSCAYYLQFEAFQLKLDAFETIFHLLERVKSQCRFHDTFCTWHARSLLDIANHMKYWLELNNVWSIEMLKVLKRDGPTPLMVFSECTLLAYGVN